VVVLGHKSLHRNVFTMCMESVDTHFGIHHVVTLFDPLLFIDEALGVLLVDAVLEDGHGGVVAMGHVVEVST
jgi:hypothetical protein